MHDNYDIINFLKNKKINYIFFPKWMTPILQPLEVSINHSFKDVIKHKYDDAFLKQKEKVRREKIISMLI